MSKFDYLDLNGRMLRLFLVVLEEGSVSKAADRLGIGQSGVSHMLDKLREITGDPLFVRAGRGIIATQRAEQLAEQIRPLIDSLQQLSAPPHFDPATHQGEVSIGAADMQREFLIPPLAKILRQQAPQLDLKIIDSGVFSSDLLRKGHVDLLISPAPPDGTEFIQQKLFEDEWVCFYDPSTAPPLTLDQYLSRPHAKVVFKENDKSLIDEILERKGKTRRTALKVGNFSALHRLMIDTDLIISMPRLIEKTFMSSFAVCKLPFKIPPLGFYMAWHVRNSQSPFHQWLRGKIRDIAHTSKRQNSANGLLN